MSQVAMIESETGASLPKLCRAATWSAHTWRCSEIFGWFLPRFGPKQLGVTCFGEKLNWFKDLVHVIHVIDISFCLQSCHIYPPFPLHVTVTGRSADCMCMCTHDDPPGASNLAFKGEVSLENMDYRLIKWSNWIQIEKFWSFSFPEANIASEQTPSQKEISIDFIFQPFISRGELLVSGRLSWHFWHKSLVMFVFFPGASGKENPNFYEICPTVAHGNNGYFWFANLKFRCISVVKNSPEKL